MVKKVSKTTPMYGLHQRLMQSRRRLLAAVSCVALLILLAFAALTTQTSAAHPATNGDSVTFTFTVTIAGGTPPSNIVFWVCPDAQANGAGCEEMTAQTDGTFTYQLTVSSGTTYQHLTIEWSQGQQQDASGPIPAAPTHTVCNYTDFQVTDSGPQSLTCPANFAAPTATPTVSATSTPTPADTTSPGGSSDDTSTLVTGLQIIIGVGLVLFVVLLIILISQRVSALKKR